MKKELYYNTNSERLVYKADTHLRLNGFMVSLEDLSGNRIGGISETFFHLYHVPMPEIELLSILYGEE